MFFFAIALLSVQGQPLVLENREIRIEVDPQFFVVTYVGLPHGRNFLEVKDVPRTIAQPEEWEDPGGLQTDLIPYQGPDLALKRGPADVVERSDDHVVMLGPPSPTAKVRLKKEICIYPGQPRASMAVTVVAVTESPVRFAVRNTARVGQGTTLRVDKTDGVVRALAGAKSISPSVVKSMRYWLIPVPSTSETRGLVLGAFVPKITHENESGTWTRRILDMPETTAVLPDGVSFLCLLDDETKSYASSLQGATAEIRPDQPGLFREVWTLKKRGM